MTLLRNALLCLFLTALTPSILRGQADDPYLSIRSNNSFIPTDDSDDEFAALEKECCNAAYSEVRTRYNYWLQSVRGAGETEAFLASIRRFERLRSAIDPMADLLSHASQLEKFSIALEKAVSDETKRKKLNSQYSIDLAACKAFRLQAQLEALRLKQGKQSQLHAAQALSLEELREEGTQELREIEDNIRRGKSALRSGDDQTKAYLWNLREGSSGMIGNPEGEARLDALRLQLSELTDRHGNDHRDAHMLKKTISAWERFYEIQRLTFSKNEEPKKQAEHLLQNFEKRRAELSSIVEESSARLEKFREMSLVE